MLPRCLTTFIAILGLSATPTPADYREAPMLAELVRAGKLPPVEQRLPEKPLVVPPVRSIGKYGGTWNRLCINPNDTNMRYGLGYEPLVRWDRSAAHVVPGLAERWEIGDGGRTYVFHLRHDVKWSDGHPFTAEDILFWFEDIVSNEDVYPIFPIMFTPDGTRFTVTSPDPHTVEFHFQRANGMFLEIMAFRGALMYAPKHYLQQFHVNHANREELEEQARDFGLGVWDRLFLKMSDPDHNPQLPTVTAWKLSVGPPATRYVAERNPYYWKVDPEGNQLPYIDRIHYTVVHNVEMLNLKAMNGESDNQGHYLQTPKYTLFMENRERGNYRIQTDRRSTHGIYVNHASKDPAIRPILRDRRFRIALAVAINREELIELVFRGLAAPARGVSMPNDPYYLPRFNKLYLEYDPDRANQLLDEVGLRRGVDGRRRMPNGEPFRQLINWSPEDSPQSEMWELVVEYWRELGLEFILKPEARALFRLRTWNGDTNFWCYAVEEIHWPLQPHLYVPVSQDFRPAPLYGLYAATEGKAGIKPPLEFQRLIDWYKELAGTVGDEQRKLELGRRILTQWSEECYFISLVVDKQLWIVSNRFKNYPDQMIPAWALQTPGYIGPEQFYLDVEE